jgi:two-component system chemotaxis response regulator CheB
VADLPEISGVIAAQSAPETVQMAVRNRVSMVVADAELLVSTRGHPVRVLRMYDIATLVVFTSECRRETLLDLLLDGVLGMVASPWPGVARSFADEVRHYLLQLAARVRPEPLTSRAGERLQGELGPTEADLVVVGVSTGGPRTLALMLQEMEQCAVPLVVAQHIPAGFDTALAERLDGRTTIGVSAITRDRLLTAEVAVLPAGQEGRVLKQDSQYRVTLSQEADGEGPTIDTVFTSAAQCAGPAVLAVIMTGIGQDGLVGVRAVRRAGGRVWVQDPDTAVVAGMPGAVVAAGLADAVASPQQIGRGLSRIVPAR